MKQRIEYIDALRGFTMLLVVFVHIEIFSFAMIGNNSIISSIFQSFHMPLFFFVSGFLAYKHETCIGGGKQLITNSLRKIKVLIIPTFILGLLFTYTILHKNLYNFIYNDAKYGYWFTLVLLQMFLLYYFICYITRKYTIKGNFKPFIFLMIITSIIINLALSPIRRLPILESWCNITSFVYTCTYFIYFVFGIVASIYREKLIKALNNKYITAITIITFFTLSYFKFTVLEYNSFVIEKLYTRAIPIILGISGILLVFNFFRTYQESFTKETKLGKGLQYIGKRTLDIYLLHYFLLPTLPIVGTFLKESPNMLIELVCGLTLAIIITVLCLIISNILRTSKFLGHYMFGAKN